MLLPVGVHVLVALVALCLEILALYQHMIPQILAHDAHLALEGARLALVLAVHDVVEGLLVEATMGALSHPAPEFEVLEVYMHIPIYWLEENARGPFVGLGALGVGFV